MNWEEPFICTTFVQFMNTLFSDRKGINTKDAPAGECGGDHRRSPIDAYKVYTYV